MTRSERDPDATGLDMISSRPAAAKSVPGSGDGAGSATAPRPRRAMQRQTMGAQVADELRRQIIAGELPEGHQLRQEQLAAEFGISKVPVREALSLLEAEGLVIQQFHKGAVVAGLSSDQIMETFELRAQVEVWLVGLAMTAAGPEDVKAAAGRAAALGKSRDAGALPELNWLFHHALYRPAGKTHILEFVHKLHLQVERFVKMQFRLVIPVDEVLREHAELLDLYGRRDPAVQPALQNHIMSSAQRLAERLDELGRRSA